MNNKIIGIIYVRRRKEKDRLELSLKKDIPSKGYTVAEIIEMLNHFENGNVKKPLPKTKKELRVAFEELTIAYNTDKCIDDFLKDYED